MRRAIYLLLASACMLTATPIANLPGLTGVTFFEISGVTNQHTFAVNSSEMTVRRGNVLGKLLGSFPFEFWNTDFFGVFPGEAYDVYFSNADGTFNLLGEYISIEASFGGLRGLNIDAVRLNFADGSVEYASLVSSFAPRGTSYIPGSELEALGAPNGIVTTMGNSLFDGDRMRVTVSFASAFGLRETTRPVEYRQIALIPRDLRITTLSTGRSILH
jgi:hypothetical protein